ncbi:MAG: hypothetical protein JWN03_5546 [Nocardia sp.]|nr:hypothetical protein [Nocardia sp.]
MHRSGPTRTAHPPSRPPTPPHPPGTRSRRSRRLPVRHNRIRGRSAPDRSRPAKRHTVGTHRLPAHRSDRTRTARPRSLRPLHPIRRVPPRCGRHSTLHPSGPPHLKRMERPTLRHRVKLSRSRIRGRSLGMPTISTVHSSSVTAFLCKAARRGPAVAAHRPSPLSQSSADRARTHSRRMRALTVARGRCSRAMAKQRRQLGARPDSRVHTARRASTVPDSRVHTTKDSPVRTVRGRRVGIRRPRVLCSMGWVGKGPRSMMCRCGGRRSLPGRGGGGLCIMCRVAPSILDCRPRSGDCRNWWPEFGNPCAGITGLRCCR